MFVTQEFPTAEGVTFETIRAPESTLGREFFGGAWGGPVKRANLGRNKNELGEGGVDLNMTENKLLI